MLEETIERVSPQIPLEQMRIVTSEEMRSFIIEAVDYLGDEHILTEPVGRNTAPAIGLAATHLLKEDSEAVMVVLSADHLIRPAEKLLDILSSGAAVANSEDSLITIGIVPTRPETGYGYIKLGELYKLEHNNPIHYVSGFKEKPNSAIAHEYYYSQDYLWNSGMFIWSAKSILKALNECEPELGALLAEYAEAIGTKGETKARAKFYEKSPSISIDFAVLERASNVLTIKADIVWDDVGDWNALTRYKKVDRSNNVIHGLTSLMDTYETTVYNDEEGIIACLGVSDLIIVRSGDITLVAHRTRAQEIKQLLAQISKDDSTREFL